jgi:cell division septal protein FtsQ
MGLLSIFKRNRRTGQTSFTSYKSQRFSRRKPFIPRIRPIQTDRLSRRSTEKTGRFLRNLKIFLVLSGVVAGFYGIFFTPLFEIQNIEVKGEADTSQEQVAIKEILQEILGKNMLFWSASNQEKALLKSFTYLKNLDIDRKLFHTITVKLETYPPVASVRVEFEDGSSENFVVNEKGYIASVGATIEDLPLLVIDSTGTDADLGAVQTAEPEETVESPETADEADPAVPEKPDQINEELIPQEVLSSLLETSKSFEGKFNMDVLEIHYLKRARELHLYTERYFFVWLDMTQDLNLQLLKLKKALVKIDLYTAPLDYIDLRISGQNGEKVIYKLVE